MVVKSFHKRFRTIGVITVIAVYFLILVGGIVRSTGSGMGCPDWPKCFGSWVPPTDVSQLPENYLEVYKEKRIEKNQKLANFLDKIGLDELSASIFSHPSQYIETEFNVTKTWIEYVNRLVGVLIGFFILLTLLYSIPYLKTDKAIFYLSLVSFIVVGIQGWLGSIVVSTNLLPITVTIHMALALVLVAILQYAVTRPAQEVLLGRIKHDRRVNLILWGLALVTFIQILLGTQVREEVDHIAFAMQGQGRDTWIEKLGTDFYVHRSFSILILAFNVYVAYLIFRLRESILSKLTLFMLGLVGAEIVIGVIMAYFAIPAFLQPLHLTFGVLLFGVQFQLLINYHYASKKAEYKTIAVSK